MLGSPPRMKAVRFLRLAAALTIALAAGVAAPSDAQAASWKTILYDRFDSGGVPSHWFRYNGPYGSGVQNCAIPSHAFVKNGSLRLKLSWDTNSRCGTGWYSGGLMVDRAYGGVDQRVTLRFRVVRDGAAGHFIIPMRWPDTAPWPEGGEEDWCESDSLKFCHTFLHYSKDNRQVYRKHVFNMTRWHTIRVVRRNYVAKVFIDDMRTPVWVYRGSSTTLPPTVKRVVLQQECRASGCPTNRSGKEVILIDWIRIEKPA